MPGVSTKATDSPDSAAEWECHSGQGSNTMPGPAAGRQRNCTLPCPADTPATHPPCQHLLQSEDRQSEPVEAEGEPEYQPTPKGRRTTMGRRPAAAALPYPYELEAAQALDEDVDAGGAAWEGLWSNRGQCPAC